MNWKKEGEGGGAKDTALPRPLGRRISSSDSSYDSSSLSCCLCFPEFWAMYIDPMAARLAPHEDGAVCGEALRFERNIEDTRHKILFLSCPFTPFFP